MAEHKDLRIRESYFQICWQLDFSPNRDEVERFNVEVLRLSIY